MKTINKPQRIKVMAAIACCILISLPSLSQELSKKEQRQLVRELKKEHEAEEAATMRNLVDVMVRKGMFVLEAHQLRDRRGNLVNVSKMINFLSLDSLAGVIQIGNNAGIGSNGVGGVTVEGVADNYKVTTNEKNGSHQVSYTLRAALGTYDVRMFVSTDGRADATISSTWPGRVNFIGHLVPPGASKVYKGHSTY